MQKPFEKRTKAKQSYWFLTNETAYLNGQQPDGRCHRRRGCRGRREPEVRKIYRKLTKKQQFHKVQSTRFREEAGTFLFANILPRGEQTDRRAAVVKPSSDALQYPYQER